MRRALTALLLGALALPAAAGELRPQVLEQLSGIEDPATAASLRALGPGVAAELLEIVQDDSVSRTRRAKALHALGWFPSAEAKAVVLEALEGGDRRMARTAAFALGNGWQDDAVPQLEQALRASDTQLRIAAASSLGNVGTPLARAALDRRLAEETVPAVRESIETSIARATR